MSCSNKCVIHASISAISVNPMRVLTLTGKPPALAASINSAATSGRKISPLPFHTLSHVRQDSPYLCLTLESPSPLRRYSFHGKIPVYPQICATIGCSSSVKRGARVHYLFLQDDNNYPN